jgi:hypothetical protein
MDTTVTIVSAMHKPLLKMNVHYGGRNQLRLAGHLHPLYGDNASQFDLRSAAPGVCMGPAMAEDQECNRLLELCTFVDTRDLVFLL